MTHIEKIKISELPIKSAVAETDRVLMLINPSLPEKETVSVPVSAIRDNLANGGFGEQIIISTSQNVDFTAHHRKTLVLSGAGITLTFTGAPPTYFECDVYNSITTANQRILFGAPNNETFWLKSRQMWKIKIASGRFVIEGEIRSFQTAALTFHVDLATGSDNNDGRAVDRPRTSVNSVLTLIQANYYQTGIITIKLFPGVQTPINFSLPILGFGNTIIESDGTQAPTEYRMTGSGGNPAVGFQANNNGPVYIIRNFYVEVPDGKAGTLQVGPSPGALITNDMWFGPNGSDIDHPTEDHNALALINRRNNYIQKSGNWHINARMLQSLAMATHGAAEFRDLVGMYIFYDDCHFQHGALETFSSDARCVITGHFSPFFDAQGHTITGCEWYIDAGSADAIEVLGSSPPRPGHLPGSLPGIVVNASVTPSTITYPTMNPATGIIADFCPNDNARFPPLFWTSVNEVDISAAKDIRITGMAHAIASIPLAGLRESQTCRLNNIGTTTITFGHDVGGLPVDSSKLRCPGEADYPLYPYSAVTVQRRGNFFYLVDGPIPKLKLPSSVTNFYTNFTTGNDTTGNGTLALPWKTVQGAALKLIDKFDWRSVPQTTVVINMADSVTDTGGFHFASHALPSAQGGAALKVKGGTDSVLTISVGTPLETFFGSVIQFENVILQAVNSSCVSISYGSTLYLSGCTLVGAGASTTGITVGDGSNLILNGPLHFSGNMGYGLNIRGNFDTQGNDIEFDTDVTFTNTFILATGASSTSFGASTIDLNGHTVTGQRWQRDYNAKISTPSGISPSALNSYFPGNANGAYTFGTLPFEGGGIGSLSDPNADRLLMWDDSASAIAFATARIDSATNTQTYADVQEGLADFTWSKPAGATIIMVELWPGGGGGGGGARTASGNASSGGGGGGGGAYHRQMYMASDLGGTVAVTIGVAGTAGTGAVADGNAGGNGGAGGNTTFGSHMITYGGGGGAGGQLGGGSGGGGGGGSHTAGGNSTSGTAGTAGAGGGVAGSTGAGAANTNVFGGAGGAGGTSGAIGAVGGIAVGGGASGASGGGCSTAPAAFSGGVGGNGIVAGRSGGSPGTGGTAGNNGNPGTVGIAKYGAGGGGGGSRVDGGGPGGNGGTGGPYGGGGGGGGSGVGGNGGAGGAGGGGYARITSW